MNHERSESTDDAGLEELLRRAGARAEPSAEAAEQVRRSVRAEWLLVVAERKRRRAWVRFSIAASVAAVMLVSTLAWRMASYEAIPMATVAAVTGRVTLDGERSAPGVLATGQQVSVGDRIETNAGSQLALALGPNLSVRMDQLSKIQVRARDRIVLEAGAVYVDAIPDTKHDALVVDTRAGSVTHVGTQFQVRDRNDLIVVIVREGRIQMMREGAAHAAAAGEQLAIADDGGVVRSAVDPNDASWEWVLSAAPTFEIEGRSLAEFLSWAARESGRSLVYASPAARQAANEIRLRGSIAGLDLDTALNAVLATTPLQRDEASPAAIKVSLPGQ